MNIAAINELEESENTISTRFHNMIKLINLERHPVIFQWISELPNQNDDGVYRYDTCTKQQQLAVGDVYFSQSSVLENFLCTPQF
mmetsp:Transcript_17722/g.30121  ORF Transcript_17722/g.30121 Transcript_17722/m.30121 type:complete len:85 (-) Transcript_17722:6310-6564(-)